MEVHLAMRDFPASFLLILTIASLTATAKCCWKIIMFLSCSLLLNHHSLVSNPVLHHLNNAPKLLSFPFIPFSNRVQNHFCWDLNSCTSYPGSNNHGNHHVVIMFHDIFTGVPKFLKFSRNSETNPWIPQFFPHFPHIFPGFRPSPALRQGAVLSTSNSPRRSCSISSSGASKTFKATCRKPLFWTCWLITFCLIWWDLINGNFRILKWRYCTI